MNTNPVPEAGTAKFKPFDVLAKQFTTIAESYKSAATPAERVQLLAIMRLIIDEADSLQRLYMTDISNQK